MPFSSRRRSFSGGGLAERSNNNRDGYGLFFFIDEKASRCSLTKSAQSTISICAAILLFTILLFLLSTFDPGRVNSSQPSLPIIGPQIEISFSKRWRVLQSTVAVHPKPADPRVMNKKEWSRSKSKLALHGMGTLFRRGTRAMMELVVAHIEEGTSLEEVRWFLRSLHRSGVTARADVVIIFPWSPIPSEMLSVIEEENKSFMKLFTNIIREASAQQTMSRVSVNVSDVKNSERVLASARFVVNKGGGEFSRDGALKPLSTSKISPFNAGAFNKAALERNGVEGVNEPLWGLHSNQSVQSGEYFFEPVWGSIVGFEDAELNPDDALHGFLDQPPMQLRRWACYQMLLGKVRHKFKHVFLTEVRGVLVLGDALSVARRKNGLYLSLKDRTWSDPVPDQIRKTILENGPDAMDKQGNAGSNQTKMVIFAQVYGQQQWVYLDKGEKEMKLVNSGVILGGIQPVRRLANAMMTEIVRVALQRKSRNPFPDCVLLTYLLQKSTVLGKKVMDHVHAVENPDSIVHSLEMTKQKDLFLRKKSSPYLVIHGYTHLNVRKNLTSILLDDICSSPADAVAYGDCNSMNVRHQESR